MEDGDEEEAYNQEEIRAEEASVSIEEPTHFLHGHSHAVLTLKSGKLNDNLLASGSKDFTARTWDIETQTCISVLKGHVGAVRSCCFSPDERTLFTAGDVCVSMWDRRTGERISELHGHQGHATSVDVGMRIINDVTDGVLLLSSAYDCSSKVWDLRVRLPVRTCVGHLRPITSSVFAADMKSIYSAGMDAIVRVFNIVTVISPPPFSVANPPGDARPLRSLKCSRAPLTRCRLSPDGAWLATSSTDGAVGVTKLGPDLTTLLVGHEPGCAVWDCSWTHAPASSRLATSGGREVLVWDISELKAARASRPTSARSHQSEVGRLRSSSSAGGASRVGSSAEGGGGSRGGVQCLMRMTGAGLQSQRLRTDGVYAGISDGTIAYWRIPDGMREDSASAA